jgi:phosphoribosyl-AMP cyclohydrolase
MSESSEIVRFGEDGLVPAVVQDVATGDVLMLAFMNDEALRRTRETGRAHYWSRSRGKLWRKGETSGNEQIVDEVLINCEQNSLLLRVRQRGAVCHDGSPTCYYRRIEPDESLTIVRDQAFDPSEVYGAPASPAPEANAHTVDSLGEMTRQQFRAYTWLRDHDLAAESGTSRRLRDPEFDPRGRIADELDELAGVLTGEHRHDNLADDLRLEASQVIYWVLLAAIREHVDWSHLRPDRALGTASETVSAGTVAHLLRADAARWRDRSEPIVDIAAQGHATLALVGLACASGAIDPIAAVRADLDDLRARPYLSPLFAQSAGAQGAR